MPQRRVHRPLAMTLAAAALTAVLTPVVTASAEPGLDAGAPQQVVSGEHLVAKPVFELPVSGYHLTARFGQTGLWSHAHTGLDFAAVTGTQIRSIAAGTVVSTGFEGAYGNRTEIRLDDGTVLWYCHQNAFLVSPGERVAPGQPIGEVGSTGHVTGPHLHLEVHPGGGDPIDPEPWLHAHGLQP